ncbi:MAG: hypothetical protein JRI22_04220 [Deltaproteobacteria bacterium]|nr:hypothetical protein [Deltaproteobacteria bacterium]
MPIIRILNFYIPLALSGILMTLQQPVINAALARTLNSTTVLGAYGITISLAVLLESPIQMILQVANALVKDRHSFIVVKLFMITLSLVMVVIGGLALATPFAKFLLERLLSLSPEVANQAHSALMIMIPWPLVIAWRRFYQGILITAGKSKSVGFATTFRILTIAGASFVGIWLYPWGTAAIGAFALLAGAIVEAFVVTLWAWPTVRNSIWNNRAAHGSYSVSYKKLITFYIPLALKSFLTILTWPIISGGISRAAESRLSLAAWPVVLSMYWLVATPIEMLQPVTISLSKDVKNIPSVRRFAFFAGAVGSLSLFLFAISPIVEFYLYGLIGASEDVKKFAVHGILIMFALPLIVALQNFFQGLLILRHRTRSILTATMVNTLLLLSVIAFGVMCFQIKGIFLAPLAMIFSLTVETCLLFGQIKRLQ